MVYVCEVCGWMYDENDGNTQVLYFKDAVATFSSFTAPAEEVRF